jgi:hypothetical protein
MNEPSPVAIPTIPGTPFGGGFYAGRFFIAANAYALIVAPKAEGDFDPMPWNGSLNRIAGAISYNDGHANTLAMAEANSNLAQRCMSLRIGDFDDWYLMSRQEVLLAFHELAGIDPFKEGRPEAFERDWYWTSSQHASYPSYAWVQSFYYGGQYGLRKGFSRRARAVRRLKI